MAILLLPSRESTSEECNVGALVCIHIHLFLAVAGHVLHFQLVVYTQLTREGSRYMLQAPALSLGNFEESYTDYNREK